MSHTFAYLEMTAKERQREMLAEARRIGQVRAARDDVRVVGAATPARDRTLLTTVGRPGVTLALAPRSAQEIVSDCVEKVAAWRRAAAGLGRSLVSVGRRLEEAGRSA